MRHWLHFVGAKYYETPQHFAREAERAGVTRRVALNILKGMNWGDRVHLAMVSEHGAMLFGEYTIKTLSGLSRDAIFYLRSCFEDKIAEPDPDFDPDDAPPVDRGCGEYFAGQPLSVEGVTLPEIARALDDIADLVDIGKPMVGGEFSWHKPIGILGVVPHRMGFRGFDWELYCLDLAEVVAEKKRVLKVGSFYYDDDREPSAEELTDGALQAVFRYRQREVIEREKRYENKLEKERRAKAQLPFDFGSTE